MWKASLNFLFLRSSWEPFCVYRFELFLKVRADFFLGCLNLLSFDELDDVFSRKPLSAQTAASPRSQIRRLRQSLMLTPDQCQMINVRIDNCEEEIQAQQRHSLTNVLNPFAIPVIVCLIIHSSMLIVTYRTKNRRRFHWSGVFLLSMRRRNLLRNCLLVCAVIIARKIVLGLIHLKMFCQWYIIALYNFYPGRRPKLCDSTGLLRVKSEV